jgi:hypothetical protein
MCFKAEKAAKVKVNRDCSHPLQRAHNDDFHKFYEQKLAAAKPIEESSSAK